MTVLLLSSNPVQVCGRLDTLSTRRDTLSTFSYMDSSVGQSMVLLSCTYCPVKYFWCSQAKQDTLFITCLGGLLCAWHIMAYWHKHHQSQHSYGQLISLSWHQLWDRFMLLVLQLLAWLQGEYDFISLLRILNFQLQILLSGLKEMRKHMDPRLSSLKCLLECNLILSSMYCTQFFNKCTLLLNTLSSRRQYNRYNQLL